MQTGIPDYFRDLAARIGEIARRCDHRLASAELKTLAHELLEKAQRVEDTFKVDIRR